MYVVLLRNTVQSVWCILVATLQLHCIVLVYSTGLLSYKKTACKFATGRVAIAIVPRVLHFYSASLCIVSCRLLNVCIVWISPKTFRSGDWHCLSTTMIDDSDTNGSRHDYKWYSTCI